VNRQDFRRLALIRSDEARLLLKARRYSGAYYLAGYVIECALKACIARKTRRGDFPDRKLVNQSYTHNLEALMGAAGLETQLEADVKSNSKLGVHWSVVREWSEENRYARKDRVEAENLLRAVHDPVDGVLTWLKLHW
jgi:HEPN domain-containing protein